VRIQTSSQIDLPRVRRAQVIRVRRVLGGHTPHRPRAIHGVRAILFGSPFVAAGMFVVLAALNVIPTDETDYTVPRGLVALHGAVYFALPGLLLVLHGLAGVIGTRRRRQARSVAPPWRWDHAWCEHGAQHTGRPEFLGRVCGVVALAVSLAPFHWFATEVDWPLRLQIGLGLCDAILLSAMAYALLGLLRAHRSGRTILKFDQFPYHPGEYIGVRFSLSRPREIGSLRFELRHIEEAYETRGSVKQRTEDVVAYVSHEQTRELTREQAAWACGMDVAVGFHIPADAPGTALSERPPRYWELHVRGETIGPDLDETFLIPIYARVT